VNDNGLKFGIYGSELNQLCTVTAAGAWAPGEWNTVALRYHHRTGSVDWMTVGSPGLIGEGSDGSGSGPGGGLGTGSLCAP
jgi:hypothetical protein